MPALNIHTHCQAAPANARSQTWQRVCLFTQPWFVSSRTINLSSTYKDYCYLFKQLLMQEDIFKYQRKSYIEIGEIYFLRWWVVETRPTAKGFRFPDRRITNPWVISPDCKSGLALELFRLSAGFLRTRCTKKSCSYRCQLIDCFTYGILNPVLVLVAFAIFRPVQDIVTPIAMNEQQNKNPMILLSYLLHALRRLVSPPSYKPTLLAYLLYWWWLKDTFLRHLGCPFSS